MEETKAAKHTPGPWRIVGADGYATAIWGPEAQDVVPETAPMNQANARLIAAAPDMFAALKLAEAFIALQGKGFGYDEAIESIRAAIAKAKP